MRRYNPQEPIQGILKKGDKLEFPIEDTLLVPKKEKKISFSNTAMYLGPSGVVQFVLLEKEEIEKNVSQLDLKDENVSLDVKKQTASYIKSRSNENKLEVKTESNCEKAEGKNLDSDNSVGFDYKPSKNIWSRVGSIFGSKKSSDDSVFIYTPVKTTDTDSE